MKQFSKIAALALSALVMSTTFSACSDDKKEETPSAKVIEGAYSGSFGNSTIPSQDAACTVSANAIKFEKFPVGAIITALGLDPATILPIVGDVKYDIPYTATYNAGKKSFDLKTTPGQITLDLTALSIKVLVDVASVAGDSFSISDDKLNFGLTVSKVTVNDGPFDSDVFPMTLNFNMNKAKATPVN